MVRVGVDWIPWMGWRPEKVGLKLSGLGKLAWGFGLWGLDGFRSHGSWAAVVAARHGAVRTGCACAWRHGIGAGGRGLDHRTRARHSFRHRCTVGPPGSGTG